MTLPSGSRLGPYEILDSLGAGGMGEVYRARDSRLQRDVAIKILPDASAEDPRRLARFEREARLLAALNHPSIATIHGLEQVDGRRFIVMELVSARTLADALATGPLPVGEAIRLGRQIAEGLEAAHARGVIHCDLKPSNIAVTPEGHVKLLDFGLARAFAPEAPEPDLSRSPTLTTDPNVPGVISGTVPYMSPEQARGGEIDKRTDIWAFGCVLYEMLTGRRAFSGATAAETFAAIFELDPDWGLLPARTPGNVRELLRRCTQKDRNRRLRDAGDARIELDETLSGQTRDLLESNSRRSLLRRLAIPLAGVAAGAALLVAGYRIARPRAAAPASGVRQLAVLPFRNLIGTGEGELMGLGMADTVSARLANVPGLQVVTPRAAVEAATQDSDFVRVAKKLGATTLLSGSLQREKESFRITYRLVDASGRQIAIQTVEGSELFALQDRVADGVIRDLVLRRTTRRTPTPSGLDTVSDQERYLQAIGLLQRYDRREGVERAVKILEQLAMEKPNSALVQAALGRADLAMFDFTKDRAWADRALTAAGAARALDPELPEVDVVRGETFLRTGRAKEAAESFRSAIAARPGNVDAELGLGRSLEKVGEDRAAEAAYRRAIELQPSFAVFNHLGALYADRGRWVEAAAMFRRAVEAAPDSYRAYSNLGGTLVLACRFGEALPALRKAQEIAPKDTFIASNLGLTQLWTGHPREALATLEAASRNAPSDFQIWGNYGDALAENGQQERARAAYEKSIELAREALQLDPANADAMSYIATGLAKTGRSREAAKSMASALALDDKEPVVLADAAIVAALGGRKAEALDWLRKAADAGYCRQIIARTPELASLRDSPEFRSIVAAPRSAAGS